MRAVVMSIALACAAATCAAGQAPTDGWLVYSNTAYGYDISYPPAFLVLPTGPEHARDGRSIRVARRNLAAPFPVLDMEVVAPGSRSTRGGDMVTAAIHTLSRTPVELNGLSGTMTEFRFVDTGDLTLVVVDLGRVRFTFHASPETPDFKKSDWWRIVESFRFRP